MHPVVPRATGWMDEAASALPILLPGEKCNGYPTLSSFASLTQGSPGLECRAFVRWLAADLSSYARTRSVEEIREAITNPDSMRRAGEKIVAVVTRNGEQYIGMVRNEDNFSLQLQTVDGKFHFFMKSELQTLERQAQSVLPAGYHSALGGRDLDDVISFLIHSAKTSKSAAVSGEADQ